MALPTSVRLYCGYFYEGGLISETFLFFLLTMLTLLLTLVLLTAFVRHRDWSFLCLAVVAFFWMEQLLTPTSFYHKYAELIGQNQKIRPVVQSGNEMLDTILNGKMSVATDAGIRSSRALYPVKNP